MKKTLLVASICLSLLLVSQCIVIGDKVCLDAGLNLRWAPCGDVATTTKGTENGTVLDTQRTTCSFGTYTWIYIQLSNGGGKVWGASETGLINICGGGGDSKILQDVPYVHQVWDTGDVFDGRWACGPTSTVMALAYYKRIAPHPIHTSTPTPHDNNFGWYLSSIYKSNQTGFTFNRMQSDASGRGAYGAYGHCTENGAAWAWRIQDYAKQHGMGTNFYDVASFDMIKRAINAGRPVVLSTQLSSAGHLILVRGYQGNNVVVNDPWGDATKPDYGRSRNGEHAVYTWPFAKAKWAVEVFPASAKELQQVKFAPKDVFVGKEESSHDETEMRVRKVVRGE